MRPNVDAIQKDLSGACGHMTSHDVEKQRAAGVRADKERKAPGRLKFERDGPQEAGRMLRMVSATGP